MPWWKYIHEVTYDDGETWEAIAWSILAEIEDRCTDSYLISHLIPTRLRKCR